jgi:hypothetical protein
MIIKSSLLIYLMFLLSHNVFSQENNKLGSWYIYNGFFNFTPKFELFVESQLRTWEVVSNSQSFFARAFFNYNLTTSFQLGFSQEYHINWPYAESTDDKLSTEEYRTTLQVILFQSIDRVTIQHRYRYEFRFLDESGKQRTRYRIQLGIPLTGEKIKKGVMFATVGNEFLLDTKPELIFSQNRLYAMLGYQFTSSLNFQFGYMYIARSAVPNWHRLQLFLTQKLFFYE